MAVLLSAWIWTGIGSVGTGGSEGAVKRGAGKDIRKIFGLTVQ